MFSVVLICFNKDKKLNPLKIGIFLKIEDYFYHVLFFEVRFNFYSCVCLFVTGC